MFKGLDILLGISLSQNYGSFLINRIWQRWCNDTVIITLWYVYIRLSYLECTKKTPNFSSCSWVSRRFMIFPSFLLCLTNSLMYHICIWYIIYVSYCLSNGALISLFPGYYYYIIVFYSITIIDFLVFFINLLKNFKHCYHILFPVELNTVIGQHKDSILCH